MRELHNEKSLKHRHKLNWRFYQIFLVITNLDFYCMKQYLSVKDRVHTHSETIGNNQYSFSGILVSLFAIVPHLNVNQYALHFRIPHVI